jgi:hypothetical protein
MKEILFFVIISVFLIEFNLRPMTPEEWEEYK